MRNAAMAILFGFCAACSSQAVTGPTPSAVAKPHGTAPDRSERTTPPTPSSASATTASGSGIMVLNQFDPPVPIEVNR
jgi:hypothetical protein